MNVHNEQHDPASAVVKQNLTTQPAAAQEAVGLIVEALKNSQPFAHIYPEAMKRHADALATAEALLSGAAPVTAAPADLIERCKEILAWQRTGVLPGDALRAYANARWPDEHDPLQIAEKETAREAFRILARAAAASTPAAPGIDPDAVERLRNLAAYAGAAGCPSMGGDIKALLDALDASPKGAGVAFQVPAGWALVPDRMQLTPENMELLADTLRGADEDEPWCGGVLWVGQTTDDDGEPTYYGLNVGNVECLEEGSINIVEFAEVQR